MWSYLNNMENWTKSQPIESGYYWAIFKDSDTPEVVEYLLNGKKVFFTGMKTAYNISNIEWWWGLNDIPTPFAIPEMPEEQDD